MHGVPNGCRCCLSFGQTRGYIGAGILGRRLTDGRDYATRGVLISSGAFLAAKRLRALEIAVVALVGQSVSVHLLLSAEVEQRQRKRAQHRLGVLPADGMQGAAGVSHIDRFVSYVAIIP